MGFWKKRTKAKPDFFELLMPSSFIHDMEEGATDDIVLQHLGDFLKVGESDPDPEFVAALNNVYRKAYQKRKA